MNSAEILELLKYGEHINLECKKAESNLPKSLWETYSAFANTDGGVILFGVEEHMKETDINKRFSFVSINNPEQRLKDFWNTVNGEKVSANILVDANVGTCEINGATIIWIQVPRADYRLKPVYINGNPMKGSFKRNHEGDYHCTEEEVKAMLRDANESGNDGSLLTGYTMNDIDLNSLRSYRVEFEHRNPEHIWNGDDDKTFLKNIGGYAVDRATQKEWLTTAGLLMFGKGLPIRERFDNIRMDYIDECNLIPGSRWSDRLTYDGMWENNLYSLGLFPPFCILFHFVPHPLDQRLDRRLIPLQFVCDLRDGFPLPELGSDESFYLILTSFVIPFLPRLGGDGFTHQRQFALFIILKYTHCDHLRSVLGEEVRKDPLPDAFCDSPVYCRPDRHSLRMEPHPFHKEHVLF